MTDLAQRLEAERDGCLEDVLRFVRESGEPEWLLQGWGRFCALKEEFPGADTPVHLAVCVLGAVAREDPAYAEGARENRCFLEYGGDPARMPPVRVCFETAMFMGTVSEAVACRGIGRKGATNKRTWGRFLQLEPLRAGDVLHPKRSVYVLSPEKCFSA